MTRESKYRKKGLILGHSAPVIFNKWPKIKAACSLMHCSAFQEVIQWFCRVHFCKSHRVRTKFYIIIRLFNTTHPTGEEPIAGALGQADWELLLRWLPLHASKRGKWQLRSTEEKCSWKKKTYLLHWLTLTFKLLPLIKNLKQHNDKNIVYTKLEDRKGHFWGPTCTSCYYRTHVLHFLRVISNLE